MYQRSKTLAERIRVSRLNANLTQKELAEKISVRQNDISLMERSLKHPTNDQLMAIAEVTGVSYPWLLKEDESGPIVGDKLAMEAWTHKDLLNDLQILIDEECASEGNPRYITLCMARDYLKSYFELLEASPNKEEESLG